MKYLSYEGLAHLKLLIKNALNNKVDKAEGKGLSTNDYTTAEKTKLSGIEEGANKTIVDSDLNETSTNPVENRVVVNYLNEAVIDAVNRSTELLDNATEGIQSQLNNKVDKIEGKGLSTNDYTTEEKTKLSGIEEGANKTIVDDNLSSTSTNPVQNKIVDANFASLKTYIDTQDSKLYNDLEEYIATEDEKVLETVGTGLSNYDTTIQAQLSNKVDKVEGKDLSTNDLTDDLLTKLNNTATKVEEIATVGGEPNIIEVIKRNGTALTVTDKAVDISVPTNNNQLTNGAGYITGIDNSDVIEALGFTPYNATNPNNYQTASEVTAAINDAIGNITGISYEVVTSLPTTGEAGIIYLISNSGSNPNIYDEYIYANGSFEKIGTTDVDLSNYVQETDLIAITNSEIDTIWES